MMKAKYFVLLVLTALMLSSCKKQDEVPPRNNTIIREYVFPLPAFLTNEERQEIDKQRKEYNELVNNNNKNNK